MPVAALVTMLEEVCPAYTVGSALTTDSTAIIPVAPGRLSTTMVVLRVLFDESGNRARGAYRPCHRSRGIDEADRP